MNCCVELNITPTNLDITSDIHFKNKKWYLHLKGNKARLTSEMVHKAELKDPFDKKHEQELNQLIGHVRNLICFAYGIDVAWGYNSCTVDSLSVTFPSIHQQNATESSSYAFSPESINLARMYMESIEESRQENLNILLNYWRRAYELDQLSYDAESFLNYFKVLECLSELGKGTEQHRAMLKRFSIKASKSKHKYGFVLRPSLKRFTESQVYLATAILAGAGYDSRVARPNLIYILKVIQQRNSWNVGHKIFRHNSYDTYDNIGQHSSEFSHVMIENIFLERIAKYYILRYAEPGNYMLDNSSGLPVAIKRA